MRTCELNGLASLKSQSKKHFPAPNSLVYAKVCACYASCAWADVSEDCIWEFLLPRNCSPGERPGRWSDPYASQSHGKYFLLHLDWPGPFLLRSDQCVPHV